MFLVPKGIQQVGKMKSTLCTLSSDGCAASNCSLPTMLPLFLPQMWWCTRGPVPWTRAGQRSKWMHWLPCCNRCRIREARNEAVLALGLVSSKCVRSGKCVRAFRLHLFPELHRCGTSLRLAAQWDLVAIALFCLHLRFSIIHTMSRWTSSGNSCCSTILRTEDEVYTLADLVAEVFPRASACLLA